MATPHVRSKQTCVTVFESRFDDDQMAGQVERDRPAQADRGGFNLTQRRRGAEKRPITRRIPLRLGGSA